jgi:hypothetical protein
MEYCSLNTIGGIINRLISSRSVVALFVAGSILTIASCASSEKSSDQSTMETRMPDPSPPGFMLAATSDDIGTVQVYRSSIETALPVIRLGSGEKITVSFDLLSNDSRTFSIYYYHANRIWERDLVPVEYLRTFQHDELQEYRLSQATDVHYSHYEYEFPSSNIDFTLSGNYIFRVTEYGDEEAILFERPFFVTEQSMSIDLALDNVLVPGQEYMFVQPLGRINPDRQSVNMYDYHMCFVRDQRFAQARCATGPSLGVQPGIAFYLEPGNSFQLTPPSFFLDLSEVRVGGRIEYVNRSVSPPEVALEPDYARFPGSNFGPFLNGQSVIRAAVREHQNPDIGSEYVRVFFRYVPVDELPAQGQIIVSGSFNNWARDLDNAISWDADQRWYEGDLLIKQGHHEYRYLVDDPALERAASGAPPNTENRYTAFLYLSDITVHSDRLVSVGSVLTN